jgi:uncharacterized damage-inducible protein DinB
MPRTILASIEAEYRRYKSLGDEAMAQLDAEQLSARLGESDNSIATIVAHMAGNLRSRFTDFLSSDGEKPWRDRDREFVPGDASKDEALREWDEGWRTLFATLADLRDADLERTVTIRALPLTVLDALHRSLAHASYHVGQIVYVAKSLRGDRWRYLSIPPGQSEAYRKNPTLEQAKERRG